jgi:hypothetical protein
MARAHKVLKSFSPKSYQSNNAMERYDRKNKKEINKSNLRSRSKWFPSLRGDIDW